MKKLQRTNFTLHPIGKRRFILKATITKRFLLIPIEEKQEISKLKLIYDNESIENLNIRFAQNHIDYKVPLDLSRYKGESITLIFEEVSEDALFWDFIEESETFERHNREKFRPCIHFSPDYGWMNDPNGMFYKDNIYHLCFQYNPYGSTWENMSWGHAISKDLITWEHLPDTLHKDGLGDIFSGGAIVDINNDAGFGKDAIIAFYTSAGLGQTQCIAYSLDNGSTFTKYKNNPILTSKEADFRDPKVFWHQDTKRWIMLLAVGQHMEIYSSKNLLSWTYESSFGKGEGAHGGVWECPDLFELQVEGSNIKRWVLLCNINPGGPFGGSATQYFVGLFDGKTFTNESPASTKWMDFGKDFYATVTWHNAPNHRAIAIGWMSNWQYANEVPTLQYRNATSIPRELSLFREGNDIFLKSLPTPELKTVEVKEECLQNILVNKKYHFEFSKLFPAYSLTLEISSKSTEAIGIKLSNSKTEEVIIFIDINKARLTMDRSRSGQTDFDPTNTFRNETIAPILGGTEQLKLAILVDTSSIEVFGNNGKFTMTNLVFPQEPYSTVSFYAQGGEFEITSLAVSYFKNKYH